MHDENLFKEKNDEKPKSSNLGVVLKKIISSNLADSTVHTIGSVYSNNDYFLKTILFVCFISSGGFCCYLTVKTLMTFFSYGVLTSTNVASDIPAECNFTFLF
jgi:hypothetical protein